MRALADVFRIQSANLESRAFLRLLPLGAGFIGFLSVLFEVRVILLRL